MFAKIARKLRALRSYYPWFFVLLAFDLLMIFFVWIANIRIFQAVIIFWIYITLIFFVGVTLVLIRKEERKAAAYKNFLASPQKQTEEELLQQCAAIEKEVVKQLAETIYSKQTEIKNATTLLSEYEEFVETWAHEIKVPLSLLNLILANQSDTLPKDIVFKLDYIRNRIQENVSQILFYYRLRGEKKDFLLEEVDIQECLQDVLADFKPLLEEKHFQIFVEGVQGSTYTDQRSFTFILSQIISNAVKYSAENPHLYIKLKNAKTGRILSFADNGCGVKDCDLPHIFTKGFTGDSGTFRKKSTGMGLYLVKQLADALKIDIEVSSTFTKGFEIRLYI